MLSWAGKCPPSYQKSYWNRSGPILKYLLRLILCASLLPRRHLLSLRLKLIPRKAIRSFSATVFVILSERCFYTTFCKLIDDQTTKIDLFARSEGQNWIWFWRCSVRNVLTWKAVDHLLLPIIKLFLKNKKRSGTSLSASFCALFLKNIFLLYSIDWPDYIVWLPLLHGCLCFVRYWAICIVIIC